MCSLYIECVLSKPYPTQNSTEAQKVSKVLLERTHSIYLTSTEAQSLKSILGIDFAWLMSIYRMCSLYIECVLSSILGSDFAEWICKNVKSHMYAYMYVYMLYACVQKNDFLEFLPVPQHCRPSRHFHLLMYTHTHTHTHTHFHLLTYTYTHTHTHTHCHRL